MKILGLALPVMLIVALLAVAGHAHDVIRAERGSIEAIAQYISDDKLVHLGWAPIWPSGPSRE